MSTSFRNKTFDFGFKSIGWFLYDSRICLNPFHANVPILYPLKTPENQRFSHVFKGYKMETLARNSLIGLKCLFE